MSKSVVLINPPSPYLISDKYSAPLGILYIAAYIRDALKIPVDFLDFSGKEDPTIGVDYRFYGFTSTTSQWYWVRDKIRFIKKNNPDSIIIVGGPHPTAMPSHCFSEGADVIVLGEGEKSIERILTEGPINIFYHSNRVRDLDSLPFPARDLVNGYKRQSIICSRGCPFSCKFCGSSNMWGNKVTYRSTENIEKEIDFLKRKYDIDYLIIRDETFGFLKEWSYDFCKMIRAKNLSWEIQTRSEICSEEFSKLMMDSGCIQVSLGIESGSEKILSHCNKKETPAKNLNAIRNLAKVGLTCRGFFIVGLPGETDETIGETEVFIKEAFNSGLSSIALATFIPYPGCEFYNDYKVFNENDFDRYYQVTRTGTGNIVGVRKDIGDKIKEWTARLFQLTGSRNDMFSSKYRI